MNVFKVKSAVTLFLTLFLAFNVQADKSINEEACGLCQSIDVSASDVYKSSCYQYVRGFLQGAKLTDTAIINQLDTSQFESKFANRAFNTRVGSTRGSIPATLYAGFCLPDNEVTPEVVKQLIHDIQQEYQPNESLPVSLYELLKVRYSCPE